jgi:hypothetical protein
MSATSTFVIVGAGLAGAKAAETLRAEGFDGRAAGHHPLQGPARERDVPDAMGPGRCRCESGVPVYGY